MFPGRIIIPPLYKGLVTGRMFNFENLTQVDDVLNELSICERKYVVKLPKQAGMKESRFMHLFSGESDVNATEHIQKESPEQERLAKAEKEIELLKEKLEQLKEQFQQFSKQFE